MERPNNTLGLAVDAEQTVRKGVKIVVVETLKPINDAEETVAESASTVGQVIRIIPFIIDGLIAIALIMVIYKICECAKNN